MTAPPPGGQDWSAKLHAHRRVLLAELHHRALWFIRVRWWAPPAIVSGLLLARVFGVSLPTGPVLAIAGGVLFYNTAFRLWQSKLTIASDREEMILRHFVRLQVGLDLLAMFLLVDRTGGVLSPLALFFIFHVIFSSLLLRRRVAFGFAAFIIAAVGFLVLAGIEGWWESPPILYAGQSALPPHDHISRVIAWAFLSLTVLLSTLVTSHLRRMIRQRIQDLAEMADSLVDRNQKLKSLQIIGQSIVSLQRLERVLDTTCLELARAMRVEGISIQLLEPDGLHLRQVAAFGMNAPSQSDQVIDLARSPLYRSILAGEPFVSGEFAGEDLALPGEDPSFVRDRAVIFVPLAMPDKVLGILGAYCLRRDCFRTEDVSFLRLAAEFVAIAVENARAWETVGELNRHREQFLLTVTHNLKAPLAGIRTLLEVLKEEHLGPISDAQRDYLVRIENRARGLSCTLRELLTLAENQCRGCQMNSEVVDGRKFIEAQLRCFVETAAEENVSLHTEIEGNRLQIWGNRPMLDQMLENLLSNAIKYTPSGGSVILGLSREENDSVMLTVRDTGIGIPRAAKARLFTEFFRAENAKATSPDGSGLGLVIVKEIVDRHGGDIQIDSVEQRGTLVAVRLPAAPQPVTEK